MSTAIEGLEPRLVWKHFAALARIPRCSKHEEAASKFVLDTARALGLAAKQDSAGNVIVQAGRITDFKVMVRPLKAVNVLHQKMAAALAELGGPS